MELDTKIIPVTGPSDRVPGKIITAYLGIIFKITGGKTTEKYFITKLDVSPAFVEFTGILVDNNFEEKSIVSVSEFVKTLDKNKFIQCMIPWNRIISIKNLNFKQK